MRGQTAAGAYGIRVDVTFLPMVSIWKGKTKSCEVQLLLDSFILHEVRFLPAHLEADALEMRVEVVQHPATIKYKGWFQHLLVDLLIV